MVRNCVWFSDGWGKDERRGVEDLDVGVDVDVAWAWRARGEDAKRSVFRRAGETAPPLVPRV